MVHHRVNNGTAEGINSKIQKTKSVAYGYPNLDNFASMCMYRFGNLVVAF
jgi:transposase